MVRLSLAALGPDVWEIWAPRSPWLRLFAVAGRSHRQDEGTWWLVLRTRRLKVEGGHTCRGYSDVSKIGGPIVK